MTKHRLDRPVAHPPRGATLVLVMASGSGGRRSWPVTVSVTDSNSPHYGDARRRASELLTRAVGPDLADDRFEPFDQAEGQATDHVAGSGVLVLARHDDHDLAYVSAEGSRGRLQLDVMADPEAIALIIDGNQDDGRAHRAAEDLTIDLIERASTAFDAHSPVPAAELEFELWGRPRRSLHERLAARLDLEPRRSLYQMRCPLPRPAHSGRPAATRPLDPTIDPPHVLAVNNRAFASHPDQSNQELDDLNAAFAAPGFDPRSVRILPAAAHDPRAADHPLIGFCWTKIHGEQPGRAALGEIYVIAVDPVYHGEGHGRALTAAGLDWLASQGPTVGMLYVESDNEPAVATYGKLGFTVHSTYTAWSHQ